MIYCDSYWEDIDKVLPNVIGKEKLYNKKILLTGATGMILSTVVEILYFLNIKFHANIDIYIASRNKERVKQRFSFLKESVDYKWVYFDITQCLDLDMDVDYIIHGASNASPQIYSSQPTQTLVGNILGTDSILKLLVRNSKGRLLYISSSEIYGSIPNQKEYKESDYGSIDCLNMRSSYPNAKRAAETLCICYMNQYTCDTVIARPGHIYGPSIIETDDRATAQFTRAAANGENIVMKSAGLQNRSYCYTLDCASALLTILINGKSGEAYNIANKNTNVTIREVAEGFAANSGTSVVFENPSDQELRGYNLMSNSLLNAEKLETLGWKAEFDLESGIRQTLLYYK